MMISFDNNIYCSGFFSPFPPDISNKIVKSI